jgi:hypothetical protein
VNLGQLVKNNPTARSFTIVLLLTGQTDRRMSHWVSVPSWLSRRYLNFTVPVSILRRIAKEQGGTKSIVQYVEDYIHCTFIFSYDEQTQVQLWSISWSSSTCVASFHHATGPSPCSAIEHLKNGKKKNKSAAIQPTTWAVLTQTVYGALLDSLLTCTPSVNFGGPGSSS